MRPIAIRLLCSTCVGLALAAGAAHAQTADPAAPPSDPQTDTTVVDEIVVTALKRNQALQDVPVTVVVADQETLTRNVVNSFEQISAVAPGLILTRAPNNTVNASVRGLGSVAGPQAFDQSVSFFVDGVYAGRAQDFRTSLFDLQSVQVVKGTQASLLGKNTSLGAIALTTRKPGAAFGFNATAQYDFERESTVLNGGVNLPVNDRFALRLAGQYQDIGGYIENRYNGDKARHDEQSGVRLTGLWTPTDAIDITLSAQSESLKSTGGAYEFIASRTTVGPDLYAAAGYPGQFEVNPDFSNLRGPDETTIDQDSDRVTGSINWRLGEYTVSGITGWSRYDEVVNADFDNSPGRFFNILFNNSGDTFSQEVRLTSPEARRFRYIVGALYLRNNLQTTQLADANYPIPTIAPFALQGAYRQAFEQDTTTWSAFGQADYDITERLSASVGVRFTDEKKSISTSRVTVRPGPFSTILNPDYALTFLDRQEQVTDGSVGLNYKATDDALFYISAAQGTKGGGFSDAATFPANAEYSAEQARTIEAGMKLTALDRAVTFNLALFRTRVDDFQTSNFDGQKYIVSNTDLKSDGAEVFAEWRPVSALAFTLNATYAETQDAITGAPVPRAPKWSGLAAADYVADLSGGYTLNLNASVQHRSSITHQQNPIVTPRGDAFTPVNAHIGLSRAGAPWDLKLIGRNLFNDRSASFGFNASFFPSGNSVAQWEDPRSVLLQLNLRY
ncbi:hypothetical protein KOAAANKH_00810 [Brevundimonas sp. NIBR10]|uniref:TonB-dependent receptor n=1 Tax=Brevundimonas sp. NIBR10 TaxID=3015997 RepID=UPI0022F16FDA|nr:TonB-dependent receptor [Brevundimonas sp. NIBR10]WGM45945.1 hypothetical protein KOAAANKH_00810 [Brevundimonas sp. NIBR10]